MTGFVNLIKPTGVTSADMVNMVKKALGVRRVGHLGTLDPAASGVLPIAVGRATKFFDYFLNKDKIYVARVHFNVETDTLDSFGKVTRRERVEITAGQISGILPKFTGKILQTPPKYSAIKVGGKRAYELSRQNVDFELAPREIEIFSLDALGQVDKDTYLFRVHCSSGTYIRTLFSDIAHSLGTVSVTEAIIRVKSGTFTIDSAVTMEEFQQNPQVISVEEVFSGTKNLAVQGEVAKKLINGAKVTATEVDLHEGEECLARCDEGLIGLYRASHGYLVPLVYLYELPMIN